MVETRPFLRLQTRRVTPKILQCVEFPFPVVENVDEHVGIVHHQPLADERAFGSQRGDAGLFSYPFTDSVHDRLQMRLRRSRTDHEKVRKRRNPAQIENHNVLSLFVLCQPDAKTR
jgi:hypothetical protein